MWHKTENANDRLSSRPSRKCVPRSCECVSNNTVPRPAETAANSRSPFSGVVFAGNARQPLSIHDRDCVAFMTSAGIVDGSQMLDE
jgi:hypothetical protein